MSNISRIPGNDNHIQYIWQSPFSLNITDVEPDIVYCVSITPVFCSDSMMSDLIHEIHTCNVTDANYTITNQVNNDQLYRIEVIPRTNLEGGLNGSNIEVYEGIKTMIIRN